MKPFTIDKQAEDEFLRIYEVIPDTSPMCKCSHTHFHHLGECGGMCLAPECECREFEERENDGC